MKASALYKLFNHMRSREVPLGLSEYMLMMELLREGRGLESVEKLRNQCKLLWTRSREDQRILDEAFDRLIRPELANYQFPEEATPPAQTEPDQVGPPLDEPETEDNRRNDGEKKVDPLPGDPNPFAGQIEPETKVEKDGNREDPAHQDYDSLNIERARAFAQEEELKIAELQKKFETGDIPAFRTAPGLPFHRNSLSRALRPLERRQVIGTGSRLNIPQTIENISRNGFLVQPAYQPLLGNQTRCVRLMDSGLEMKVFQLFQEELDAAWDLSSIKKYTETYFINRYPLRDLYLDEAGLEELAIAEVLSRQTTNNFWIIYSDAGAMHGLLDNKYYKTWERFLQKINKRNIRYIWLNPVPEKRWKGTMAAKFCREHGVPMFELNLEGARAAIHYLLGQN